MRRDAGGQRRLAAVGEQLVGALDDGEDHALARVGPVARGAGRSGEDQILGSGRARAQLVAVQLVAQDRADLDLPHAGIGLGLADQDARRR